MLLLTLEATLLLPMGVDLLSSNVSYIIAWKLQQMITEKLS